MSEFEPKKMPTGFIVPPRSAGKEHTKAVAHLFCHMTDIEQAEFFDKIGKLDEIEWDNRGIFQWRSMQEHLTDRAKRIINDIKEHTE